MAFMLWFVVVWTKLCSDAHYYDGYQPSAPLNVMMRSDEQREHYRRLAFTYEAYPGRPVPALMALPPSGTGPFPVCVFLHGVGQEKEFIDEVAAAFTDEGLVLTSFDQYMQGERKLHGASPLGYVRAMRQRGAMTVHEARRLVDYLVTRPDIDKDRIYLIGASYGAMTGATAGAFEKRFRAVALVYGGGGIDTWVAGMPAAPALRPGLSLAGKAAAWIAAPFDPVEHVGKIAPRPIFFLNGERDRIVPPRAAKRLYEAAGEPKTITWYPSDHLDLDPEYIPIAVKDCVVWFKQQDAQVLAARASGP